MPRRLSSSSWSLRLFVSGLLGLVGAGAVACSNLSLDAGMAQAMPPGGDTASFDSGVDGATASVREDADAGPTGMAPKSPLCGNRYDQGVDAGLTCEPDTAAPCAPVAWPGDAATHGDGGDGGTPRDASAGACHVVTGPAGNTTQACAAAGAGGDGAQCQTGADCMATFECVGSPGRCRQYCCGGDTTCKQEKGPQFCDIEPVAWGDLDASADASTGYSVPVCVPANGCTLLVDATCTPGQTCTIVKDDGTTSCVAVGPMHATEPCDTQHCAAGLTCLGSEGMRLCYQLCRINDPSAPCDTGKCTGSAQLFKDPSYGICQ
jgi:hypothetical protein